MSVVINAVVDGLVWLINACYALCHNYWIAILIFTFLTKVILLPLSIWVQKNSIKSVRMQPEMNFIKAKYWGNQEMISEEQYKLFKKEKYSPFADLIPLFVQLALLMGVVEAVKRQVAYSKPPAPYITSSLQQDAVSKLKMTLNSYTKCAQSLYEGVQIQGEGKTALVTYIRTDLMNRPAPSWSQASRNGYRR